MCHAFVRKPTYFHPSVWHFFKCISPSIARIYTTIYRDMLLSIDAPTVRRTWKVGRRWPTYIIQTAALYTAIESTSSVVLTKFRRCKLPTTTGLCLSPETLIGSSESSEQTPLSKSALNESTIFWLWTRGKGLLLVTIPSLILPP